MNSCDVLPKLRLFERTLLALWIDKNEISFSAGAFPYFSKQNRVLDIVFQE